MFESKTISDPKLFVFKPRLCLLPPCGKYRYGTGAQRKEWSQKWKTRTKIRTKISRIRTSSRTSSRTRISSRISRTRARISRTRKKKTTTEFPRIFEFAGYEGTARLARAVLFSFQNSQNCRITIDKLQRKKRIANESQMCYS